MLEEKVGAKEECVAPSASPGCNGVWAHGMHVKDVGARVTRGSTERDNAGYGAALLSTW